MALLESVRRFPTRIHAFYEKQGSALREIRRNILNSYDLLTFDASWVRSDVETSCRKYRESDLDDVLNIESASFEYPWSRRDFEYCLTLDRCGVLIAERKGVIVGYLVYEARRKSIRLLSCAVAESERRSGVGSFLLRELAARFGATRSEIVCFVRERNVPAQLFLRRQGFRAQWIKRSFYSSAEEDAYQMTWRIDDDYYLADSENRQAG